MDGNNQEIAAQHLQAVVLGVISTMAMTELTFSGMVCKAGFLLESEATGLIHLSGTHEGMLAISMNRAFLRVIISRFLGVPGSELSREDLLDGVAELANMVGGGFKSRSRLGGMRLSPPVALLGEACVAEWKTSQTTQVLTFQVDEDVLQVSLSLTP